MKNQTKRLSCLLLATVFTLPAVAFADGHIQANLAESWRITPKPGHGADFVEAFKKHLELRASKNDPKVWKTYSPVIGDDLSYYVVRSCCHTWADADSYAEWSAGAGVSEHWNKNVDKHVASYSHYYAEQDFENSNWPEDDSEYRFFAVTSFYPKPGHVGKRNAAKAQLSQHAKAGKWGRHWGWGESIGGAPAIYVVSPYRNYGEMAPLETSLFETIAEQAGSEDKATELFQAFNDTMKGSSYTVYRLESDMSMKDR